ncbi:unnamed protein product, partial [Pylaiella littoralis]
MIFLLTVLLVVVAASAVEPQTSSASATADGNFLSVTSWHARTLTNISWNIPDPTQDARHLIVFIWDEEATEEAWWLSDNDNISSRAVSPPSSTASDSRYVPYIGGEEIVECTFQDDAFDSRSDDAFITDENRELVSVDLADGHTWWYTASLSQERPNATTATSGVGQASVLLSEPGFYTACLLLVTGGDDSSDERCPDEECVNITVYQPPYNFLEASFIESTNLGAAITVRYNLASRSAYSGDWGWVLGGVDPSLTLADANSLGATEAEDAYVERCWFYFGRAVELGWTFLCSSEQADPLPASVRTMPTLRGYQYGRFQMYLSIAGNGSLWFGKSELYTYSMLTNFYTCGVTVQPLNSTTVTTTTDIVVTAIPERGETCDVGDGLEIDIFSGEVSANINDVEAWIYFSGRVLDTSIEKTSVSIRLVYKGEHEIMVALANGVTLATLNVSVTAADPYAPSCEGESVVTLRPPSSSPEGSSVLAAFRAQDFYGNSISERWGDGAFQAWSFASVGNLTAANVYDDGNGSYRVVFDATEDTGTAFLFVERDGLGIPGSPFEVFVFGPDNCAVVSTVGDCQSSLSRPVSQDWVTNSPCLGMFEPPAQADLTCVFVPIGSDLGITIVATAVFSGLYSALFLWWIRWNRRTVIVKLSQPFVCQLFLVGCIVLNITAACRVGVVSDPVCLARPWMLHVGLTFTSSCLYMKTYRVHRIFNNSSKLSRISITDRQLVSWVLSLVAVDVLLLLVWSLTDRPRKVTLVQYVDGIEATISGCAGGSEFPSFSAILWSWKACLNIFGVIMAAKTWHCEDGVGESQQICLSVYNTTLLGLVNLAIPVVLADSTTVIGQGAVALTLIGGTAFTVSVLFGPKVYKLWAYGDLSPNAAERRSSATLTNTCSHDRRGSLTGSNGGGVNGMQTGTSAEAARRKSSTTVNLKFMALGKILPIDENKKADGEKKGEGPGDGGAG